MLKKIKTIIMAFMLLVVLSAIKINAQEVNIDFFYDQLSPYGHWFQSESYGWTWQPANVYPGWKPYSDGYWIYTDNGWTYQADNNWAWAVYHYGRWAFNESYGWIWVPGNVWSPAWVAWRHGNGYIGWAPLPPEVGWSEENGLRVENFNMETGIHWSHWCFVEDIYFNDPFVNRYIENTGRNVTLLNRTNNTTNYVILNRRIVNNCIEVREVERVTNHNVVRYNIIEADSRSNTGISRTNSGQVMFYRPAISQRRSANPPTEVIIRERNEPEDQMIQRHEQERKQHDEHFDKKYNELVEIHNREASNPGTSKEELSRQHDAELKAFNEHRDRETKVLENRHQQELNKSRHEGNKEENRKDNRQ
jgi:hypothetical protein